MLASRCITLSYGATPTQRCSAWPTARKFALLCKSTAGKSMRLQIKIRSCKLTGRDPFENYWAASLCRPLT
jgi:hypothetical protein